MTGYHVTTEKKVERYKASRAIIPPVRFWPGIQTAQAWATKTGRSRILKIEVAVSYPLPDHRPARWSPEYVREWEDA